MRYFVLLAAIFLFGCYPYPANMEVPSHAGQSEAISIIQDFFQEKMGPLPYPDFPIIWYEGTCLEGEEFDQYDFCVTGYHVTKRVGGRKIYLIKFDSIHNSSLSHELVHYWQDVVLGDSDTNHENKEWWNLTSNANDLVEEWECRTYSGTERCPGD